MITKEEREALRKMCESPAFEFPQPERQILNLIDALDEVESRAKRAKWERDKLAEALAWGAGREKKSIFDALPWCDAKDRWLEWAAQEAAKGEDDGRA